MRVKMSEKERDTFVSVVARIKEVIKTSKEDKGRLAFVWGQLSEADRYNLFCLGVIVNNIDHGDADITDEEFRVIG